MYIINNEKISSTNKIAMKKCEECFYIKRENLINPKFYLNIKENNIWINKNFLIKDYESLVCCIYSNRYYPIYLSGFSIISIYKIIKMLKEIYNMDFKFIDIENGLTTIKYDEYIKRRVNRK